MLKKSNRNCTALAYADGYDAGAIAGGVLELKRLIELDPEEPTQQLSRIVELCEKAKELPSIASQGKDFKLTIGDSVRITIEDDCSIKSFGAPIIRLELEKLIGHIQVALDKGSFE